MKLLHGEISITSVVLTSVTIFSNRKLAVPGEYFRGRPLDFVYGKNQYIADDGTYLDTVSAPNFENRVRRFRLVSGDITHVVSRVCIDFLYRTHTRGRRRRFRLVFRYKSNADVGRSARRPHETGTVAYPRRRLGDLCFSVMTCIPGVYARTRKLVRYIFVGFDRIYYVAGPNPNRADPPEREHRVAVFSTHHFFRTPGRPSDNVSDFVWTFLSSAVLRFVSRFSRKQFPKSLRLRTRPGPTPAP